MNRIIRTFLLCSLMLAGFKGAGGQEINVHVLDAQNGRSMGNEVVWLQFYEAPANRELRKIEFKTAADGVAHMQLPAPLPTQLFIAMSIGTFWCSGLVNAATEEILSRGAVSGENCKLGKSVSAPEPRAGEVVLFVRRKPIAVAEKNNAK